MAPPSSVPAMATLVKNRPERQLRQPLMRWINASGSSRSMLR